MLDLEALIDVRNALDERMNRFDLPHNKVVSVVTAMMGKKSMSRWPFKQ